MNKATRKGSNMLKIIKRILIIGCILSLIGAVCSAVHFSDKEVYVSSKFTQDVIGPDAKVIDTQYMVFSGWLTYVVNKEAWLIIKPGDKIVFDYKGVVKTIQHRGE